MEHLTEERYISLLTDFGFKRIFGTKPNKDLLINFLNSLFKKEQVITDVKYLNNEHVGDIYTDRKAIFDKLFEEAEIAKFTKKELHEYEDSLKAYRDIKNSLDTAMEQGFEKGREEGRKIGREEGREERSVEIAHALLAEGVSIEKIMLCTGLSAEQIKEN